MGKGLGRVQVRVSARFGQGLDKGSGRVWTRVQGDFGKV